MPARGLDAGRGGVRGPGGLPGRRANQRGADVSSGVLSGGGFGWKTAQQGTTRLVYAHRSAVGRGVGRLCNRRHCLLQAPEDPHKGELVPLVGMQRGTSHARIQADRWGRNGRRAPASGRPRVSFRLTPLSSIRPEWLQLPARMLPGRCRCCAACRPLVSGFVSPRFVSWCRLSLPFWLNSPPTTSDATAHVTVAPLLPRWA